MNKSEDYYNRLANSYREISEKRAKYLATVDRIVAESASELPKGLNYLDVGAGDGYRSVKIIEMLQPRHATLLDSSSEMAARVPNGFDVEVVVSKIQEFESSHRYDLITCLWNVLAHFGNVRDRMVFFERAKQLLSDDGRLILDVNNRYNISEYGQASVMANLSADLRGRLDSGWFQLGQDDNFTEVYVHAPQEIDCMAAEAGLEVEKVYYVDYTTGEIHPTFFEGQLLYIIRNT